jgi:hypothetical protein
MEDEWAAAGPGTSHSIELSEESKKLSIVKKSSVLISPLTLTGDHNNYSLAHRLSTREMNQISQVVDLESLFGGGLQIIMVSDCKYSQSLSSSQAPLM